MNSAEQIITTDIEEYISKFDSMGGVIDFKFFNIIDTVSHTEAHLLTTNRTLELLGQDNDNYFNKLALSFGTNRDSYFKVTNNEILSEAATNVTPEDFFGPYFNFKQQRPILLGKKGKQNGNITFYGDYYYYDDIEIDDNIISIKKSDKSGFITQGYADAFLSPPHSFGKRDMTNFDIGKFFLEFNEFLFDDINEIVVYSWSTDYSNYFDAGKEWWGSFFWTVYNPTKKWYIGITASTTD